MHAFELAQASVSVFRYEVYIPLHIGFEQSAADFSIEDVIQTFSDWINLRMSFRKPFFSGTVTLCHGVFGWLEAGNPTTLVEANAMITLSSHPELTPSISEEEADEIVESLVAYLADRFNQVRVYLFKLPKSKLSIYQRQGTVAPTQQ
jgi:hypothetical protein